MKRYDLELTATGPVMEESKEGAFVPFSEISGLADTIVKMGGRCQLLADLLREVTQIVPAIGVAIDDLPAVDAFLERIEVALAGQAKGRTITEGQELELTTVLQSIANGFSDDPAHDAAALLKRIAGEVPWTGDSFRLPPRQDAQSCNQPPSLTGQVFAGLSAATALSGLDASSAADVAQLMLEAAEAKGGEPCATESPSSSPD
ncbi:TPA: hypothetical protein RQN15_000530 [Aeromonas hydrophila]|nr:hypothetical protein [Aeromonas hydrophila]